MKNNGYLEIFKIQAVKRIYTGESQKNYAKNWIVGLPIFHLLEINKTKYDYTKG